MPGLLGPTVAGYWDPPCPPAGSPGRRKGHEAPALLRSNPLVLTPVSFKNVLLSQASTSPKLELVGWRVQGFFASSPSLNIPGIHFVLGNLLNKSLFEVKHPGTWQGHPRRREGWEEASG